jgi:hypothetical protein
MKKTQQDLHRQAKDIASDAARGGIVVNFDQTSFVNEVMMHSIDAPAQAAGTRRHR